MSDDTTTSTATPNLSTNRYVIIHNVKQHKQSESQAENVIIPPGATLGGILVAFGIVFQFVLAFIMIASRSFDTIIFLPLAVIIIGTLFIKLSGVKIRTVVSGVIQTTLDILFPFI